MVDKMNLFFFGLLQIIALCAANEYYEDNGNRFENSYDYTEERYGDGSLSAGAVVAIVFGCILFLILKIFICYYRLKLRTTVVTRTVVIRDTNPQHAGYDQQRNQPPSPPSYNEVVSPEQGPTITSGVQKEIPPPYSPVP